MSTSKKLWPILIVIFILAIFSYSAINITNQNRQLSISSSKREKEKRVFSKIGTGLNPKIYAEFRFLPGRIEVTKPGRLFQDFGILKGSVLVEGNGLPLIDAEQLGRCMITYQRTRTLELKWSSQSKLYTKKMSMDDNSFEVAPKNFDTGEFEILEKNDEREK